ncbi:MAG: hypothetical protein ACJAYU_004355 [Bradymonadia bacterium]|jgi:hypothetical protein
MGVVPFHEVQPKGETVDVTTGGFGESKPDEPCTPPIEPYPDGPVMGASMWEPELMEMGDVAIDLDPLYQQEQLAVEILSQFNVTLEEEEIVPCDGEKPNEDQVREVEPVDVVPTMGRMLPPMVQGGLRSGDF